MSTRKVLAVVLLISMGVITACSAGITPTLALSALRISTPGHIMVRGSGFTPKHNVSSHLRKPDGSEYPVLPLLTDERGEFTHDIDTLLLPIGKHDLWVVDDASNKSSNRVQFEVTTGP